MYRVAIALTFGVCALTLLNPAWGEESPAATVTAESQQKEAKRKIAKEDQVTRFDLAAAYLRFERAVRGADVPEQRWAELNRGFDQATLAFFGGQNAQAVQAIDALTHSLKGETPLATKMAHSLRVRLDPPVRIVRKADTITAKIRSLYPLDVQENTEVKLSLVFRNAEGAAMLRVPFSVVAAQDAPVNLSIDLTELSADLAPATYDVDLVTDDGVISSVGQWVVSARSLKEIRAENEAKLVAIASSDDPAISQALATCRARNQLLTDEPSATRSAEFLADPHALILELNQEIALLSEGKNPYQRKGGDYWRVLQSGDQEIPMRIYAPAQALGETPVPLVIVLHGAGGDENLFMDGYGAGIIKTLADQYGFLVASPVTYSFGSKAAHFDELVATLSRDYALQSTRVFCLGHSMGGAAAAGLAGSRGDKLTGVCCLAGSRGFAKDAKLPPTLVVAAELDLVVPAKGIQAGADKAIAAGQPVEFRLLPDQGHTLMVGKFLPEAVQWLLERK
jgi:predicted esterase